MAQQNFTPQGHLPKPSFGGNPGLKIPAHIPQSFLERTRGSKEFIDLYRKELDNAPAFVAGDALDLTNKLIKLAINGSDISFSEWSAALQISADEYAIFANGELSPETKVPTHNPDFPFVPQLNTASRVYSAITMVKPSILSHGGTLYSETIAFCESQMRRILEVKNQAEIKAIVTLYEEEIGAGGGKGTNNYKKAQGKKN